MSLAERCLCASESASSFGLQLPGISLSKWKRRWDIPKAAPISNFHSPMHSLEVKTRTSTEEIKSLRLITATKTPYLPNGRLDLEAYDSLIRTQIANGVEGVVVGGTTGEGHLMSKDERVTLIAHTVASFGDSLKVIGNAGSNSTSEAILASEQGFAVGMDAALHVNPYYGKTSTLGLKSHFESVLCVGPTIIYNVPSRTGQDIPPRLICSMAGNFNAIGVKECAESTTDDRIGEYGAHGLAVWSGNDDRCHNARWERGASGVVSVASNIVPGLMRELMFEGQNASLSAKMMPLFRWLFSEPNPIGINTALAQLGIVRPVFRLPYAPLPIEKRADFVTLVEALGRESFVGVKDVRVLQDDDFILLPRY